MKRSRLLAACMAGILLMNTACDSKKKTKKTKVTEKVSSATTVEETSTETTVDPIPLIEGDGTMWSVFRARIEEEHKADPERLFALGAKDPEDASSFYSLYVKEGEEVSEYAFSGRNEFSFQKKYPYDELSGFMAFHSYEEIMSLPLFPSNPMMDKEILSKEEVRDDIYMGKVIGVKKDGSQVLVDLSSYRPLPEYDSSGYILVDHSDKKFVIQSDEWDYEYDERELLAVWMKDPKINRSTGRVMKKELNAFVLQGILISRRQNGDHFGDGKDRGIVLLNLARGAEFYDGDSQNADDVVLKDYESYRSSNGYVRSSFFWYSITHDLSGHVADPRYTGSINSDDWYVVDNNGQEQLLIIQSGYLWFVY